jgi:hypothetical protein
MKVRASRVHPIPIPTDANIGFSVGEDHPSGELPLARF